MRRAGSTPVTRTIRKGAPSWSPFSDGVDDSAQKICTELSPLRAFLAHRWISFHLRRMTKILSKLAWISFTPSPRIFPSPLA